MNASTTSTIPTTSASSGKGRQAAIIGGGVALFALGALATALVVRAPQPSQSTALDGAPAVVAIAPPTAPTTSVEARPVVAPEPAPVAAPKPVAKAPAKKAAPVRAPAAESNPGGGSTTPLETQHAVAPPVCANCGVIEAVTPVVQKGEGTGIGAVAGGVLGGVLGHQVGGGTGKKAMTVLGAVGGGLAGHEVEKRQRSTTVYQHKIRMADGSTRTITQSQQLAVGLQVQVDGLNITPAPAGAAAPGGARSVETSSRT